MLDASFAFTYNFVNKLFILKFQMILKLDFYGHIILNKWRDFYCRIVKGDNFRNLIIINKTVKSIDVIEGIFPSSIEPMKLFHGLVRNKFTSP